jgi:colanic acid/amylovoran biosynthesis glycosyltransferase
MPSTVESHIVCERTDNLDQFVLPNVHSLESRSAGRRLAQHWLVRLKLRDRFSYVREIMQRLGSHVLHSHWGDVGWLNRNLRSPNGRPLKHVVTFYGKDVNYLPTTDPRWAERYRELFRKTTAVVCEGPHMAKVLVSHGCPPWKIHVIHLGVEVEKIEFRPRTWSSGDTLRFLIAASFREKKGIPYALEAIHLLAEEGWDIAVTIIGDASEDPRSHSEKAKILATLESMGLQKRARLMGYQPHSVLMEEAYRHHIFMSPSITAADGDTEGGAPVSIIEMAASGMPVVATRHCDIPEVIRDRHSGLLAEERDPVGLYRHLQWLVQNPERWRSLASAARTHVESEFDVRKQSERLANLYRTL